MLQVLLARCSQNKVDENHYLNCRELNLQEAERYIPLLPLRPPSSTARCASKGSTPAAPESERAVPGGDGAKGSATPLPICLIDSVTEVKGVSAWYDQAALSGGKASWAPACFWSC